MSTELQPHSSPELVIPRYVTNAVEKVVRNARREVRWTRQAKRSCALLISAITAVLLLDYVFAFTMWSYLDPTLGGVSLGPAVLALSIPVMVLGLHMLMRNDESGRLERWVFRLAVVGCFAFLLGLSSMIALVYYDSSDGLGKAQAGSGLNGSIGGEALQQCTGSTSWLSGLFGWIFADIPPLVFFIAMSTILFVTGYIVHKLIGRLEQHYEFFQTTSGRAQEVLDGHAELKPLLDDLSRLRAEENATHKRLPEDHEEAFAAEASAAISATLHGMKRSLNLLDERHALVESPFPRRANLPPHINDRKQGSQIIAELRQNTTRYAILQKLGALPPLED